MLQSFRFNNADECWLGLAKELLNNPESQFQNGRGGTAKELLHVGFSILNPRERWIVSREPALNPAFAIAEVIWIVNGRNDAEFLNYFNRSLPKYAGTTKVYPGAYGHRLCKHFRQNQLNRVYEALKADSNSRQAVLQIWDPETDMPNVNGTAKSQDIPCNICSLLKVRNGSLEWTQVMRSNDLFRGVPYNVIQFTMLQEIVAGWLGKSVGSYNHISDSLHVYEPNLDSVSSPGQGTVASNTDFLLENKIESTAAFSELAKKTDMLVSDSEPESEIELSLNQTQLSESYRNMFAILCAESARRRGFAKLMSRSIESCTNPLFVQLFGRWLDRISRSRHVSA